MSCPRASRGLTNEFWQKIGLRSVIRHHSVKSVLMDPIVFTREQSIFRSIAPAHSMNALA